MKVSPENLKPLMQCSVCGKAFLPARVLVLSEERDRTTLHLQCEQCKTSSLVLVSPGQWGVTSVGMLTDLTAEDAQSLFGKDPISTDQVLEMHSFLKQWKGDIRELVN